MNCATHSEVEATAFCRSCGRALCPACGSEQQGVPYCETCRARDEGSQAAALEAGARWRRENPERDSALTRLKGTASGGAAAAGVRTYATQTDAPSPFLALILGLIPGVGAVYNGHYAKAVFHVVIFGGVVTLIGAGTVEGLEVLFVMLAVMFFLYMPIESYRTARALKRGEEVDEFSGLLLLVFAGSRSPVVGVTLIGLGVIFLLQSLGYWRVENLLPYWPVSLIGLGMYMLYRRFTEPPWQEAPGEPPPDFGRGSTRPNLGFELGVGASAVTPLPADADDSVTAPEPVEATRRNDF